MSIATVWRETARFEVSTLSTKPPKLKKRKKEVKKEIEVYVTLVTLLFL
jgi:hypothetical protein